MRMMVGLEKTSLDSLKNIQHVLKCKSLDETIETMNRVFMVLHYAYQEQAEKDEVHSNGLNGYDPDRPTSEVIG